MASKRANLKNGRAAAVAVCVCMCVYSIEYNFGETCRFEPCVRVNGIAITAGCIRRHTLLRSPSARGLKKTCVLLVLLQCYIYQRGVPLVVIANNARMPWNREMASMDQANFFLYFFMILIITQLIN